MPDIDENDDGNAGGYSAAYVQLNFASAAEVDPYAGEAVPACVVASLRQLNASSPGVLPGVVGQIVQVTRPDE